MRRLRQLTQAVGRLRSLGFAEAALVVPMEQQAGRTVAQPWLESGLPSAAALLSATPYSQLSGGLAPGIGYGAAAAVAAVQQQQAAAPLAASAELRLRSGQGLFVMDPASLSSLELQSLSGAAPLIEPPAVESGAEPVVWQADSVRRKRKRKMNKHKHRRRRKLNRHRQ